MAGTSAEIDPSTAATRTEELVSPTSATTRTEELAATRMEELVFPTSATTRTEKLVYPTSATTTSAAAEMAGTSAAEIYPSTATTKTEEPLVSPTSAAAETAVTSAAEIDPSTSSSSVATAANMEELLPSTFSFGAITTAEMEPLLRNERNVPSSSSGSIIKKSLLIFLFFSIYISVGTLFYCTNSQYFSGVRSKCIVDGLYFSITTFHTVGYGDIVPITPATKVFDCIFVLIAVGPFNIIISDAIDCIVDIILDYIVDLIVGASSCRADMELIKMYVKVASAIVIILFYIGLGALGLYIMEDLDWMNSVYLSVISMTTVGYGDMFFKTMTGRMFAFLWLLFMPIATKLILFLGNAFIDTCRWITNRVLI